MKENFDDIIRRRWEEQKFPVDDVHRQEMERLLDGEKKRRGIVFWWIGGLAVAMLIGFAVWNSMGSNTNLTAKSEISNEAKSKAEVNSEVSNSIPSNPLQGAGSREGKPDASAQELHHPKNTEEKVKTNPVPEKTSHIEISKPNQVSKNHKTAKPVKKEKLSDQTDKKLMSRTEDTENTKKIIAINEIPIDPVKGVGGEKAAGEAPKEGYKVELENPNQVSILSKEASIQVFADSIEYDPWTNAIYHNGTVRSLNKTKPLDALSINEVESLKKNTPGMITPHTKLTHPLYFMAEAGLGFVLASKPFYDGGIKFNVGGGLGMKLIPRVHLQLTGGYLMQDGGFHFERTSAVNTLSFGVRSQFNTLQPDRLHFIYGKLGAAYRFQRSTLDVQMGVQWLYGAQGNITIQQQSQFPPSTPQQTNYSWLSTDGLRKTQWWSDVSYGYMLAPKLYLHGGVTFYYSSLTEANVPQDGFDWNGKTAAVQPFITLNYLLHANF